ncbi:Alpha-1 3-glucosyltransferase [Paragonimus heterotremus]|uniref:Alpha-1,3-glucosyltransferase n=1 Tax=Paragonimus heterotremus TaxID=100268 RepID=A0A8J4WSF9_9TREM|nr:Alpha-1 3-glucosyltransferase [Paragonimus heterotremus]
MWRFLVILLAATILKILFIFSYSSKLDGPYSHVAHFPLVLRGNPPGILWRSFQSTSKWTLDYPPLFAWFEWLLSQVAVLFDPEMCVINESAYVSQNTVIFQRCSVISTEFLIFFALWRQCAVLSGNANNVMKRRFLSTAMFLAFNFGLFVIDHIHFQYNGFLFGILFLSGAFLVDENYVMAAACFTVLLNMKHIFIYVAPVYVVFILFNYCLCEFEFITTNRLLAPSNRPLWLSATKLVKVGTTVLAVTFLSFGPFLSEDQLRQIFARLFPFERGLTHAYWAPNVWAVYNALEKLLCSFNNFVQFWPRLNTTVASMTGGLVGQINHVVLPNIRPLHTVTLTLSFMLPSLIRCAVKSSAFGSLQASTRYTEYLTALVGAAWSSFLFGWHVHEKAVLMVLLPLKYAPI